MLDHKVTSRVMEWTGLGDSIMKRYEKFSTKDDEIKRRRQSSNKHKDKKKRAAAITHR